MEKNRIPDVAKCRSCKRTFDLPTVRERKDYTPGICPICGGTLRSIYERKPPIRSRDLLTTLYAMTKPNSK